MMGIEDMAESDHKARVAEQVANGILDTQFGNFKFTPSRQKVKKDISVLAKSQEKKKSLEKKKPLEKKKSLVSMIGTKKLVNRALIKKGLKKQRSESNIIQR